MLSTIPTVLILTVTLLAFTWIGVRARSTAADLEDYLLARDSQPAGALALSFFASGMGVWILVTPPEVGARVGVDAVVGYALGAAGPFVVFALVGPRIRRVVPGGHSLAEFLRLRFGRLLHAYVVGIGILYMWVFVTAELTVVGLVTARLGALDARAAVVAVAAATLAYTAYGGLRASLRTDRWQGWIILALLAVTAVEVLRRYGGTTVETAELLGVDRPGVEAAITLIIAVTAANLFHQGYWQRVWAAADDRALRRGALVGGLASIPVVLLLGLAGIYAVGVGRTDPTTTGAILPVFDLLAGDASWVAAVVLVLGLALVASSVDTLENGLAAQIAAEWPRLRLGHARLLTAVAVVPAVVVAWQGLSVLRLFLIADLLAAATAVPALLGLWRRTSAAAALGGAVAGLVGAVVAVLPGAASPAEVWGKVSFADGVPTLPPFLGAVVASTVVAVGWSLLHRAETDLEALAGRVRALGSR